MKFLLSILILCCILRPTSAVLFSDDERARLVAFWNAPGRYVTGTRESTAQNGPWVVRTTPEASQWFYAYNRALKNLKSPAAPLPDGATAQANWEKWVSAKLLFDTASAQAAVEVSNAQNAAAQNGEALPLPAAPLPEIPGPIPLDLLAVTGNPPPFFAAVVPRRYAVAFETGETIVYTDQIKMPARSPYFRFSQGVMYSGVALRNVPDADLDALFVAAGMTPFEGHVVKAVSRLEGGFESVNTYDTGFLSVGFIQFATLSGGAGSLGAVLKQEKATQAPEFERDFRVYGVDVNDGGELVVIDPATGAELSGAQAVLKVIDDKRLTAVFQRAGASAAFRVAQIQIAKQRYYPAENAVNVVVNGLTVTGKISDVIKSEAGMATLFDRKVNTGNVASFADVLTRIMAAHALANLADAAAFEREIVQSLKYRADFLADKNLTQPP